MANKFLDGLNATNDFIRTENGAVARSTTGSKLYDMFALGGAYRTRSDDDCILLFKNAYEENPTYALKCLFYLGDARGGQGERRFFRVCAKWLAKNHTDVMRRNLPHVPEFRRWDDLYAFVGTPLENEMFQMIKHQLALDVECKTPSLLAKWLKSENTSSKESRELGKLTRSYLGLTSKQYRKILSNLRARINVLERLMSQKRWDEIEFDKIPSRAGIIYRNAFARHDVERERNAQVQTYADFARDANTKVNASVLYPYECVAKGYNTRHNDETGRLMLEKYWDNLADYFKGATFNGMAVVDTSGSMWGSSESAPLNVAVSLGMYCAEKAKGPFAGHFMTFSSRPKFVRVEGADFWDKIHRMRNADWGQSTDVEAAFDLMLTTALQHHCSQEEIPENLIVISDMEFNYCVTGGNYQGARETLFETIEKRWNNAGYKMPHLVFWNVQARQNNIPMRDTPHVTYVSGFSPAIFEQIMKGKSAWDLMMDKLDSDRYSVIK